ncbi:MAG: universal stress protein [Chloroflexota bacterium]
MRTLLCVSETPHTKEVVAFGQLIISALQSEVVLLTVRPKTEGREVGEALLSRTSELLSMSPSNLLVRNGLPSKEILAELKTGQYDLVVVGARDHPPLGVLLVGSVARQMVEKANTSVLLVRRPKEYVDRVLICTAGYRASERTVAVGAKLAQALQAEVTLLHCSGAAPHMYAGLTQVEETLAEFLQSDTPVARQLKKDAETLGSLNVETRLELRHGVIAEEILRANELTDFGLTVIGSPLKRVANRLFLDEVPAQIVDHMVRPLLIVKGGLDP